MSDPRDLMDDMFSPLVGRQVEGGCDDCDAYQTVRAELGGWWITVHHDDCCPAWLQIRRRRP